MSIKLAEQLKKELTDKYVVVAKTVPELKRFANLTGFVKTVNMNGRALVQFDGPEDIGWYDIAPEYLTVVDAPQVKQKPHAKPAAEKPVALDRSAAAHPSGAAAKAPKAAPAKKAGKSPLELAREQGAGGAAAKPAAAKPAAAEGKKLSPLELARRQGAAKSGAAKTESAPMPAAPPAAGKKLSPLELARMQDSAGTSTAPAAPKAAAPASAAKPAAPSGKKLSPLELARMQDGKQKADAPAATAVEQTAPAASPEPATETAPKSPAPAGFAPTPGDTASIITLARQQGAFKG
jgi:hypothetical protein